MDSAKRPSSERASPSAAGKSQTPHRLVILDRDGVINEDSDAFIKNPDEWLPIDGSLEAIALLNRAGHLPVVISNQSGLARGLFSPDDLNAIHAKMRRELGRVGGHLEAIFFCPHGPDEGCSCRKPETGLFIAASQRLCETLEGVPAIGDSWRDIQAARRVGARPILVRTGKGESTLRAHSQHLPDVPVYDNLARAVDALLSDQ